MNKLKRKDPHAQIEEAKRVSENPYAEFASTPLHFSGETIKTEILSGIDKLNKKQWNLDEIEEAATNLQLALWKHRARIWEIDEDIDPAKILRPEDSLSMIGFAYKEEDTLGQFFCSGKPMEVAGIIDRDHKQVSISQQFKSSIKNFTAAHELGHALLHNETGLHRDRPMDGSTNVAVRDPIEREADKFATYFLMPKKMVTKSFSELFGTDKFLLNELTSFALISSSIVKAETRFPDKKSLALYLAKCNRFNAKSIVPMHERFGVSAGAMAIRFEELNLVQ